MAKKKYYAVSIGTETEIFTDWSSCEKAVKGVAGAKYKSFATKAEAKEWLENPQYNFTTKDKKAKSRVSSSPPVDGDGIIIFTDGGCINNPGPGGYGIVIVVNGKREELSGGFHHTTNNRMEMMAAIIALKKVLTDGWAEKEKIILHSDSSYLVNGMEKGWAKGWRRRGWKKSNGDAALNADLWAELLESAEKCAVQFRWVKGHAGNPLNERCDELAVAAARANPMEIDRGYEEEG